MPKNNFFHTCELYIRKLKYQSKYYKLRKHFTIFNSDDTLDYIIKNQCSVSRFGDGEFDIIRGKGNGFCTANSFLQQKLIEVCENKISNHIVCIPYPLIDQTNLILHARIFWIAYFCKHHLSLFTILSTDRTYYDSVFTRFYSSYKDKSVCKRYIDKLKLIWNECDVLIIEGEYSRIGVGNNLFHNANSIKRILCPTKDAYLCYDEILKQALLHGKDKLILLALGQTATALSFDLANAGYWAIDIGHVDLEYEWYLMQTKNKSRIKNKHVNEAKAYIPYEVEFYDERYEGQIIDRILK